LPDNSAVQEELRVSGSSQRFVFRPWVRRAGWSILSVAFAATVSASVLFYVSGHELYWLREKSLWVYVAVLWIGGLRIVAGTYMPAAEIDDDALTVRPLHNLRGRVLQWRTIVGSEQTIPGDRLILHYATSRGPRFVALNLNLVKGRRDFEAMLALKLRQEGLIDADRPGARILARVETG